MSGPLGSSQWMYASGFEIEQSLKFNQGAASNDDAPDLTRTFTTPTSDKISTLSAWVKRGELGGGSEDTKIFGSRDAAGGEGYINFNDSDKINIYFHDTNVTRVEGRIVTTQVFRDPSAWYHIVVAIDTTQGTASNRMKLYVNGEQITELDTNTQFDQNDIVFWNRAISHHVGERSELYLAEMHFIDGQQLTPSSFGETGTYGEWKPKEYSGSYGTNGFYLPFKQDYTVEGFSTTLYKGTGGDATAPLHVGGVGFQPDLVWTRCRTDTIPTVVFDAVRGENKQLDMNVTDAETSRSATAYEFETDGFSVSNVGNGNNTGQNYVAWSWDMGSPSPKYITANGNAKISTTQEKFGSSSAYFDGTGDYLSIPQSHDFDLTATTTSNFTVECWVYHTDSIGGDRVYISQTEGTYENSWYFRAVSGGEVNLTAWSDGNSFLSVRTGVGVVSQNTWHHVALVKSGTTYKIFIDGTDETDSGGTDSDTAIFNTGELRIGDNGSNQFMTGYIDEIRISDTARYSSNFTPSASAFTRDSNTKLLMHNEGANNSTEFLDHSGMDVNTDGGITSNVKANTTYGQSIVSYTGTGSATTVGHGLDSAPDMVIVKRRNSTEEWPVYHSGINPGWKMYLNGTAGEADDLSNQTFGNLPSSITSTTFGVGDHARANASGSTYVAYCFHDVTGYSKFGSYAGSGSSGNKQTTGFAPALVIIKIKNGGTGNWYAFDNVRTPGTVNKATRLNTNEVEDDLSTNWSLTFLSDGFEFLGSGPNVSGDNYIYAAFADNREYAYWLDQSGNNNDWTSNNLTESDISVDTPNNNFATLNPLNEDTEALAEGNLQIKSRVGGSGNGFAKSTMAFSSGKWYAEYLWASGGNGGMPGISPTTASMSDGTGKYYAGASGKKYSISGTSYTDDGSYGSGWSVGDIVGVAMDADNNTLTFYKNGDSMGTAYSSLTDEYYFSNATLGGNENIGVWNFGQDSSFAGNKTAQGYQDGNDIGDFFYEPPTGFLALCTDNLPDVAVTPSEHFNTITYTGTDSTTNNVNGVGFAPDWVWLKRRNAATSHALFDKVRGANKVLGSNTTNAEQTDSGSGFSSFDSDGFTVVEHLSASGQINLGNMVSWNWKANGAGSQNTSGTINTTATSANVDGGFSIITYTGNGTSGATIGHGLSKAPEFITIKRRNSGGDDWNTYYGDNTDQIKLNSTAATADNDAIWNDTSPSSTLITLGNHAEVNNNNDTYVAYAFHSVDGYSKVGSYEGNGNADGTFVYTGFRPALVITKPIDATGNWNINDSVRSPDNVVDERLKPNSSDAESDSDALDFTSNGFKIRTSGTSYNQSAYTYIYIAFAETPFKYSNGR